MSSLFETKTRFQAWLNGPTEIQNFSRRDRHQDLRVSDERGRKEKEEMVFNPKTSGALEGDNRKSISPIKSVRKPMVERTRTSCIINLSFSLSLYLFLSVSLEITGTGRPRFEILIDDTDRIHATRSPLLLHDLYTHDGIASPVTFLNFHRGKSWNLSPFLRGSKIRTSLFAIIVKSGRNREFVIHRLLKQSSDLNIDRGKTGGGKGGGGGGGVDSGAT